MLSHKNRLKILYIYIMWTSVKGDYSFLLENNNILALRILTKTSCHASYTFVFYLLQNL